MCWELAGIYMGVSLRGWGCLPQVATREDPASARLGETVYRFVPRSIVGNLQDAMQVELNRLQGLKASPISMHNRCVHSLASVQLLLRPCRGRCEVPGNNKMAH